MAKTNLTSMSVDALLKLREDIGDVLSRKAAELKKQLSMLAGGSSAKEKATHRKASSRKGSKVAPKYLGPEGETWSGRGLRPRWLAAALKDGKNLEDFLIEKSPAKKARRKKKAR